MQKQRSGLEMSFSVSGGESYKMNQETDLVHLFKNTEKMFKCVRCRERLSPPFSHCTSGHLVCSQCRGSTCPTPNCKGSLVSSAVLDGLFELLPKPCEYSDRGCGDVSVSGRHEHVCEFRTIRCTVGTNQSCTWSGTIRDWKEHVELEHKDCKSHETDLVHLFKNIEKIFKCVGCQNSLSPPFSHCTSGHLVCSHCRGPSCPTPNCKGSFVSSAVLERLFELQPKPCEYSKKGCGDVSVRGRHEQVCEFRTIACTVGINPNNLGINQSCSWSGTIRDWKKHVQLAHFYGKVIHKRDSNHVRKGIIRYLFQQKWVSTCTYQEVGKKVFLFFMENKNGKLYFASQYIPIVDDKFSYYMKVKCCASDVHGSLMEKNHFNFAIKANVLKENESLKSKSNFYGVLSSAFSSNPYTNIEFEVLKIEE